MERPPPDQMKIINTITQQLREDGLITFIRWNLIFIAPPLTITTAELDKGLAIIAKALKIADKETRR